MALTMPKAFLSRDVEMTFRDLHTVRAKAGTPLLPVPGGDRRHYAIPLAYVETDSPTGRGTLWAHDARYFYIWAPADAVTMEG